MDNITDTLTKELLINEIKKTIEQSTADNKIDFNLVDIDKYSDKIMAVFNSCKEKHGDLEVITNPETGESTHLKNLKMEINKTDDIALSNMMYISLVERK